MRRTGVRCDAEAVSWSELLENYDLRTGKACILVPAAMAVGPELTRRLAARERDDVRDPQAV